MYIYNVTIKLQWQIHDEWLAWMKQTHITNVLNTKCFTDYKMVRLLDIDEDEGPTYAVQYFCNSLNDYEHYINNFANSLRQEGTEKFGNKFIGFRTLMQIV
ncbi:MAG: DUF4286 family protein [Chitinophagaceae bacterium]